MSNRLIQVVAAGDPLLNLKLMRGLLRFGRAHPDWGFAFRTMNKGWEATASGGLDEVHGYLHVRSQTPEAPPEVREHKPYVAVLGRVGEDPRQVTVDDRAIGRMGAIFLLELGLRSLAFCGSAFHWSDHRLQGFVEESASHGLECRTTQTTFTRSNVHETSGPDKDLREWLCDLDLPAGVMAAHDRIAVKVIEACRAIGRRVPEDVAVLGVGNQDLICEVNPVRISSIETGLDRVAERAAHMLMQQFEGEAMPTTPVLLPPLEVVSRRSTSVLSYPDRSVVEMLSFIRSQTNGLTTPSDVTDHVGGASRRTLERRFREHVGRTIGEEIRLNRARMARRMLLETNLYLVDIAVRCGYADSAHFSRHFKQLYGVSPSAYRDEHAAPPGD